MAAGHFVAELADRLKERQALDVADGAADFAQHEVEVLVAVADKILDRVCDVRNHLDGRAKVIAAALLGNDVLINLAGADTVALGCGPSGEALVVTEVEIGLSAVVGDEDFAMLIGRHRSRIDVEIGIELAQTDLVAARLQQRAKRC